MKNHNLETLIKAIEDKDLNGVLAIESYSVGSPTVLVKDKDFGVYSVDLKSFSPSSPFPLHKQRRHKNTVDKARSIIGTSINGLIILDVFYGPDRGYKNRSFFLEYKGECGHVCVATRAVMLKHKKSFKCQSCAATEHGDRIKRTPTYSCWLRAKAKLPKEYQDYSYFKSRIGDKPFTRAKLDVVLGKPVWTEIITDEDQDVTIISAAVRQAFRKSKIYKEALEAARVETSTSTLYRCAACQELFPKNKIQIDHIEPIRPTDGTILKKEHILDRTWTKAIQVLDKKCHSQKSTEENKIRRVNKKKIA